MRALVFALSVNLSLGCIHSPSKEEALQAGAVREAPGHARQRVEGTILLASASDSAVGAGLPSPAIGPVPDYDRFTNREGEITDIRRAWAMVQNPDQVERLYADAIGGSQRATRVCLELEQYFRDIGSNVAEKASSLDCILLPPLCKPDWGFLGFLSRTRPGGVRLRNMVGDGFQARARELALQKKLVLSMINLLMAGVVVSNAAARVGVSEQVVGVQPLSRTVLATTKLYRAVSEAELSQLLETGRFHQGPNALGGKWFAESATDAATWANASMGRATFVSSRWSCRSPWLTNCLAGFASIR